jgi:NADPH-dependent 2,4-dienoyl-CoA reductase/sulfur reductase-like enzyme/rhodanese-related sulfurtransferase
MKTVIIGGVAAGMSAATRLRRLREDAEIIVFEMSPNVSYANCGLPYFVSDVISDRDSLLLQTPASLHARFRLDVRVSHKVVAIHTYSKTVTVKNLATGEEFEESYDNLVIATGAKPRRLDIPGIDRALTLRDVVDADNIKQAILDAARHNGGRQPNTVVLGAGFIGVELAENLVHMGVNTTLLQRGPSILSQFDPEMIQPLQAHLVASGVNLIVNATPAQVTPTQVLLTDGRALDADVVFSATGVVPDNSLAVAAGLKLGSTGGLWVDAQQRTSNPFIYAAGDAVEKQSETLGGATMLPLANLANRHGRLIADAIAGVDAAKIEAKAHPALGTIIIGAFGMAAGITGLTERAAIKAGIDHHVVHLHPGSHASYYPGASRVSLKVVFEQVTGRILGAQAVGMDGVDKRIDVLATAIRSGLTVDDLMDLELAYSPQFGSAKDPINQAGYVGSNVLHGTTPTIQWHQLEHELANGRILIDVRTHRENEAGAIPGAINIPVDELRNHIDELTGKLVVVSCQVGQRGHTATQILRGHGIDVVNLSGGYLTWKNAVDGLER